MAETLLLADPPVSAAPVSAELAAPAVAAPAVAAVPRFALAGYDWRLAEARARARDQPCARPDPRPPRPERARSGARASSPPASRTTPQPFAGIDAALDVIRAQIAAGGRIIVHGDYDVDGVCATAILVRGLRSLGADVGWFLPGRLQDGYGLSLATVNRLVELGTDLIITVDCAITAVDEVAAAHAAGIEVVVTDHHAPVPTGPPRLPDRPSRRLCDYPFAGLCGAGVAHKLAEALGASTVADDLDLVALATVADLVPLVDENRRLVRDGLRRWPTPPSPACAR